MLMLIPHLLMLWDQQVEHQFRSLTSPVPHQDVHTLQLIHGAILGTQVGHLFHLLEVMQCQLSIDEHMSVFLPHCTVV